MIAIVFLYMLAAIFIYGGELNAALIRARAKAQRKRSVAEAMAGETPNVSA
jgi:membrane protein